MKTKTINPARAAQKAAQLTTRHARAAVRHLASGAPLSAGNAIRTAAKWNQRTAELAPGSTHAERANAEYTAAADRISRTV